MRRAWVLLLAASALCLPARELLEIKADYLLYSYDFNYIYGQGNVLVKGKDWAVQAGTVEMDVAGRIALASRDCRVEAGKQKYSADLLEIDLETLGLKFTTFRESIRSWTLPGAPAAGAGKKLSRRDLEGLRKSLVYFLSQRIVITPGFRVYGYQTTAFIEGVQSVSFRKFKLDQGGNEAQVQGAGIDKIWFYPSQGVVVNSHLTLEKPVAAGAAKTATTLDLKYDVLNNGDTPPRGKIYFDSLSSLDLDKKSSLSLSANFVTANMFNARFALRTRWTPTWSSEMAAEYSRAVSKQEELWLRLRSNLQGKALGEVALDLAYETERQYQASLSLQNQALKSIRFSLLHSRSRLRYGEDAYNRLSQSEFSLGYTHRLFQMVADYQFHRDLLQNQSQGTPRFTFSATPFRLYHGLLQLNFSSTFMVNQLNLAGKRDDQRRANLALNLQSETIRPGRGPAFSFSLAAEQLMDPERLNRFTSLGGVLRCSQSIAAVADIDFLYNFNTRRQTEAWLIQGSTSQDWSAVLRLKEGPQRLQGWVSVSYDTKAGNFTTGYLDCTLMLIKNWRLQTQMNYDFVFRNFNYDLYLIRSAGRFMVRASYRSLSRRFLVELLPR